MDAKHEYIFDTISAETKEWMEEVSRKAKTLEGVTVAVLAWELRGIAADKLATEDAE